MLTFQQGTKLVIVDGTNRYLFKVSSASAAQTYTEVSQSTKTIHNPNIIDRTFASEKSQANISFVVYIGNGLVENVLLRWFGLYLSGSNYIIDPNINALNLVDIYIDSGNTIYKIKDSVGRNVSFTLSRKELLKVEIEAIAPNIEIVSSIPEVGTLYSQDSSQFSNGSILVDGYSNIAELNCEITRDVAYMGSKSIFDIGNIFIQKNPVLNSMAISGSIIQNKVDDTKTHSLDTNIKINYGPTFEINLTSCSTTDRWDMGSIHKKVTDYKLLPTSVNSYIKF